MALQYSEEESLALPKSQRERAVAPLQNARALPREELDAIEMPVPRGHHGPNCEIPGLKGFLLQKIRRATQTCFGEEILM